MAQRLSIQRPTGRRPPQDRHLIAASLLAAVAGIAIAGEPAASLSQDTRFTPDAFTYLGAIRLPQVGERPETFDYSGNAMTFNPLGDPAGQTDGFPGSLILTGHDRTAYGEVPDGDQLAELSIPAPVSSKRLADLPEAKILRGFTNSLSGQFTDMEELPRVGLAYLDRPETGPKLHLGWTQHFEVDPPSPTHLWLDLDLSARSMRGPWFVGAGDYYAINGYLLEIPQDWADRYVAGRPLATGGFRDGGWSGMGPALYAYRPWSDAAGTPPPAGSRLEAIPLLRYRGSTETDAIEGALLRYQHPDEWEGAAWLTTRDEKSAVLFAGTKSVGRRYWYGFVNPAGPDQPCVYAEVVDEYPACRLADGSTCAPQDQHECQGHNDYRGWWSSAFEAQFILYDPADLARRYGRTPALAAAALSHARYRPCTPSRGRARNGRLGGSRRAAPAADRRSCL